MRMLPSLPLMVRLPARLVPKWMELRGRYQGMSQSMLLRFVVVNFLEQEAAAQDGIIDAMIRGGGSGTGR